MPRIHVVAGILRDDEGRILLGERVGDSPFAGLWEFPGGKVGDGETSVAALKRELAEELGIRVNSLQHLLDVEHDYDDRLVALEFYDVLEWTGIPAGLDGQRLRWEHAAALDAAELLPADVPVVAVLQATSTSKC